MGRWRAIVGSALGGLLLTVLAACGTVEVTSRSLVQTTATAAVGATPTTGGGSGRPGSGTPIFSRPSDAPGFPFGTPPFGGPPFGTPPIPQRPTGTPPFSLPGGSGRPTATALSAGAVQPDGDGNCPTTHPIKAAQLGPLKTYFTTDNVAYSRTRATECFAKEADAEAAGYRKAPR